MVDNRSRANRFSGKVERLKIGMGKVGMNILAWLAGVGSCLALVIFGALIMANAGNVKGTELGGFLKGTLFLGGLGLMVLGLVPSIAWFIDLLMTENKVVILLKKIFGVVAPLCLVVICVVTIVMSAVAEHFKIDGWMERGKLFMIAVAAVWFSLSFLALTAWFVRKRKLARSFVWEIIGLICGIVIATEGIVVFGMAGETEISGIGTLPHFIVLMIGAQLILLGGAVVMGWVLSGHRFFKEGMKRTLLDGFAYLLMAIIVVDGLAGLAIAARLDIVGIGSIMEYTMTWFTAQLVLLGLLALFVWIFRANGPTPTMKRFGFLIWLFLILMLPPAFLL